MTERKHRHILDVTCTIMLLMKVPKYLWSYAIFTVSYLINRMPSTPLGGEILIRRLRPDFELFSLPPRVFGCLAFVQDLFPRLDKLSPRSIKCVFVKYSRMRKEYRCFHPPTRRYYVSVDVTFFQTLTLSRMRSSAIVFHYLLLSLWKVSLKL